MDTLVYINGMNKAIVDYKFDDMVLSCVSQDTGSFMAVKYFTFDFKIVSAEKKIRTLSNGMRIPEEIFHIVTRLHPYKSNHSYPLVSYFVYLKNKYLLTGRLAAKKGDLSIIRTIINDCHTTNANRVVILFGDEFADKGIKFLGRLFPDVEFTVHKEIR